MPSQVPFHFIEVLLTSNSWSKSPCFNSTTNKFVISLKMIIKNCKSTKIKTKESMSRTSAWILYLLLMKWTKNSKKEVITDTLDQLIWTNNLHDPTVSSWLEFNNKKLSMGNLKSKSENSILSTWQDLKDKRKLRPQEVDQNKEFTLTWHFQLLDKLSRLWFHLMLLTFHTEIRNWPDYFKNLWEEMQRQSWLQTWDQLTTTMIKLWVL